MALKFNKQTTIGSFQIQKLIDPEHYLVRLASFINWEEIHQRLNPYYSIKGRMALGIRLMVGLHILKHVSKLTDRACTDRLRSDIYWMYFCNTDFDQLQDYKHLNSSSMTRFRKRIGDKGFAVIETVIRETLLKEKVINRKVMIMDTSVQENNITYPTDSGLLDKGRRKMLEIIGKFKAFGIDLPTTVRSYSRVCKKIILNMTKFGKAKMDRVEKGTLELGKKAKYVQKKLSLCIKSGVSTLSRLKKKGLKSSQCLQRLLVTARNYRTLVEKIIHQSKVRFQGVHVKNKVYSLHESQTVVISKGKRGKPNEYGCKFNISTDTNGFIVSNEVVFANKSDVSFVEAALKNWESKTGRLPEQLNADRGMWQNKKKRRGRIIKVNRVCIPSKGKKKNLDHDKTWFRKGQRQRAGVEAVIGHLKQDHGVGRCRYKGMTGNKLNLHIATTAWNLKKWVRVEEKRGKTG